MDVFLSKLGPRLSRSRLLAHPLGLYDLYDDHDNVSEEVLVTDFALFTGSLSPIPSGKGRLADPGYRQGDK